MNNAIRGEFSVGYWMTPVVRRLLGINVVVYLLYLFTTKLFSVEWIPWEYLALSRQGAVQHGMVWQFITYMYLHANLTHLLVNLLGLVMFGRDVEQVFGSVRFFTYYTLCGFGAGVASCVAYPNPVIGASGALFGVLLAFAALFPYRPVYLLFVPVPFPAWMFVALYGLIDLIYSIEGGGTIAYMAHIGGLVTGLFYFWLTGQMKFPFGAKLAPASRPSTLSRWVTSVRQKIDRRRAEERRLTAAELDAILDKIAKSGMNSLTRAERSRLKNASAELRKGKE